MAHYVVALAGNPNTGKSTVFNALTGLNQHTGNWPGKTVTIAWGGFSWRYSPFSVVDLPGTYSLFASSPDEEVARDFICFGRPDVTVVVADATCLERNLNLVLQVMEITPRVVVCLNLMDEARRRAIHIDIKTLGADLGVPVVPCAARRGEGIRELKDAIFAMATGRIATNPKRVRYSDSIEQKVSQLLPLLQPLGSLVNPRWLALRLLDDDHGVVARLVSENGFKASPCAHMSPVRGLFSIEKPRKEKAPPRLTPTTFTGPDSIG